MGKEKKWRHDVWCIENCQKKKHSSCQSECLLFQKKIKKCIKSKVEKKNNIMEIETKMKKKNKRKFT